MKVWNSFPIGQSAKMLSVPRDTTGLLMALRIKRRNLGTITKSLHQFHQELSTILYKIKKWSQLFSITLITISGER